MALELGRGRGAHHIGARVAALALVGALVAPTAAFPQGGPVAPRAATTAAPLPGRGATPPEPGAIRPGDYTAAPIIGRREGVPAGSGRLVGFDAGKMSSVTDDERPLQLAEVVYLEPPAGAAPAPGTAYLAVEVGPRIRDVGQALLPTGIVVVERAQNGRAVEARVRTLYRPMLVGQAVIPLEMPPASSGGQPVAATGGPVMHVAWVAGSPELPTLSDYLVLDAGARAGLQPGDQVMLYRPEARTFAGSVIPESEIAIVQVLRVFRDAASARIISQRHAVIGEGTAARISAKMP